MGGLCESPQAQAQTQETAILVYSIFSHRGKVGHTKALFPASAFLVGSSMHWPCTELLPLETQGRLEVGTVTGAASLADTSTATSRCSAGAS